MLTIEEIETIFEKDDIDVFKEKNVDHKIKALNLLRDKIPYETCPRIIIGASHDVIYLCSVEKTIHYLSKEDYIKLAEYNIGIEDDHFMMFA